MAKNNMKLKYKTKKRERKVEVTETDKIKSAVYTVIGVFLFFGLMYLCVFGLIALCYNNSCLQIPTHKLF